MFNKKMMAGILFVSVMALSSVFSFAAAGSDARCPGSESSTAVQVPKDTARGPSVIQNALDSLVKDGTISKEQKDAVIKAFEAKRAQIEKEREELEKSEQLKKGTDRQGKKHFENKHRVLKDLVDDGVITPEQAEAIRKAIRQGHDGMKKNE